MTLDRLTRRSLFGRFAAAAVALGLAPAMRTDSVQAASASLTITGGTTVRYLWPPDSGNATGNLMTYQGGEWRPLDQPSWSSGQIMPPPTTRTGPVDLRLMCWDCKWTGAWVLDGSPIQAMLAPFEEHVTAAHPGEVVDHEMQWRPSGEVDA